MKHPDQCETIIDIRTEIDRLDQQIIMLLSQRFDYVKAAAQFKTSGTDVKATDRLSSMLKQRRAWAEAAGLSPDVIEKIYQDLVEYFIHEEMKHWQNHRDR